MLISPAYSCQRTFAFLLVLIVCFCSPPNSLLMNTIYTRLWPASEYNLRSMYLLAFDAMWTVAQMLNITEEMRLDSRLSRDHPDFDNCRNLDGDLVPLDEFNHSNAFMGCVMSDNYHKINFTGMTVSFTKSKGGILFLYTGPCQICCRWDNCLPAH